MDELKTDVAIIGGGLAGLCAALQLRARFPQLDIRVIERAQHPLPAAAHKVGESTVEIGAHYFAETLGLREHLEASHVRKFGFRFFFSDGCDALDEVTELGVSRVLKTPTWQIDRGVFETFLGEEARRRGIRFDDGAVVRALEPGSDGALHAVRFEAAGTTHTLRARWLVDASGRAGLLKRRLGLEQANDHHANAVWFRLDHRIDIDEWCDDRDWLARCTPPERWRSTNHLVGPGYWVWLIPLGSGAHSVGIVADAAMHPIERMRTFDDALAWLGKHQPAVARECAANRDHLLDFHWLRGYSHGCRQVFSADRWAIVGDAGVFLDPFYSPGSDFIAIGNTYLCELIALDLAGRPLAPYARIFEDLFFSFYKNTLTLYQDQYPLFGDAEVLPIKVVWDYAFYWGVLCPLVFQERLADIALLGEVREDLLRAQQLNARMQAFFREWHARSAGANPREMLDQRELEWFVSMNDALLEPLGRDALLSRLRDNVALLHALAHAIGTRAAARCPGLEVPAEAGTSLLPALFRRAA
jgi:flavin-dependent dehydrogenase